MAAAAIGQHHGLEASADGILHRGGTQRRRRVDGRPAPSAFRAPAGTEVALGSLM